MADLKLQKFKEPMRLMKNYNQQKNQNLV